MNDDILTTTDLTKRYGDRAAVDHVSISVRRGEVYGFLGPNGAGKTTTLRMVLGLIRPTSGAATIRCRAGALIEGPGFYPYLCGRDNLKVLADYRGLRAAEVERVLDLVCLNTRAADRFKSYSLGMKQRLGVAAALLGDPELVILDEPTNGLDPAGMADMRDLVRELARDGRTVLLSSHLLHEVEEICDRVGVISQGRLLGESTVADLRGASVLRVRATPSERAATVVRRLAGESAVRLEDDRLLLDLPPDRAPEVTGALVAEGITVHEITPTTRSLEEIFLEMTEDKAA